MAPHVRIVVAVALAIAIGVGVSGCASAAEPAAPENAAPAPVPTDDPGAALVEQKCSMCHGTDRVWAKSQDAAGWAKTIERMKSNGLVLGAEEEKAIIDYLGSR